MTSFWSQIVCVWIVCDLVTLWRTVNRYTNATSVITPYFMWRKLILLRIHRPLLIPFSWHATSRWSPQMGLLSLLELSSTVPLLHRSSLNVCQERWTYLVPGKKHAFLELLASPRRHVSRELQYLHYAPPRRDHRCGCYSVSNGNVWSTRLVWSQLETFVWHSLSGSWFRIPWQNRHSPWSGSRWPALPLHSKRNLDGAIPMFLLLNRL